MSSSPTFLDNIIVQQITGSSVLDVACGYGRWANLIYSNFWEVGLPSPPVVDGFDAFAPNVEFCSKLPHYRRVWKHTLPERISGKWDTVLACEIIEHIGQDNIDKCFDVLEECAERRIIITTPNWPAYRGGGQTNLGFNEHEAHLSYIPIEEFERRGYGILGAGFGPPGDQLYEAGCRRRSDLIPLFASLSHYIPEMAHTIVAIKNK